MISIVLIIVSIIVFLKLNKFYQFTILALAVFLPFSYGDFRSIPSLLFVEWLTVIVFLMLINELIPLHSLEKKIHVIKFKGIEIFIFAILILLIWTVVSFVNYEILYQSYKYVESRTGTTRLYFNIVNNVLLFFATIMFTVVYFEQIDFAKFFKFLYVTSIFVGVVAYLAYVKDFNIPILAGTFGYNEAYNKVFAAKYGGQAYRLGGMAETVTLGIPALFAYYIIKKKISIVALVLLLFFVFISGGRTLMIGVIFAITFFSFVFLPRNFIYMIAATGLFIILGAIFLPQSVLQGQFGRLTSLNSGNFMGQDASRGLAWKIYLDNFSKHPIWGKGISEYEGFVFSALEGSAEFAKYQAFAGGHGSYLSLLSTFGIGGLTYFLIMIVGGLFLSFRKIKQYISTDITKTAIGVFGFMVLGIKAFDFITGGNGLSETQTLFYTVGLVASLTVLQNRKDLQ